MNREDGGLGLRARLCAGTSHDSRPFWVSVAGGFGALAAAVMAGEAFEDVLSRHCAYVRR